MRAFIQLQKKSEIFDFIRTQRVYATDETSLVFYLTLRNQAVVILLKGKKRARWRTWQSRK